MTSFTKDFDEIGMYPTINGMTFCRDGDPEMALIDLRVTIEAESRNDWRIEDVAMMTTEFAAGRKREISVFLEGDFLQGAKSFLYEERKEDLQDKVDLEMLPDYEDTHPYTPITT